jgi:hypothetical protein
VEAPDACRTNKEDGKGVEGLVRSDRWLQMEEVGLKEGWQISKGGPLTNLMFIF